MTDGFASATLPPPPAALFIVGIGGIGMSALAQFLCWQGYAIAGSDRELDGPGRDELYGKLRAQGIRIFPQDGSGVRETRPALLVYSTAVEEGNPDFTADAALPRMHRAQALAAALNRTPGRQIGIAGSCGKTSVTGWIAAALQELGQPVCAVCGGYMNNFITPTLPGNFYASYECGKGSGFTVHGSTVRELAPQSAAYSLQPTASSPWLVYEVDESDGSLVSFRPDVGVVLNIGTDHYDRAKLLELFATYLGHCKSAGVILDELHAELALPSALPVHRFAPCVVDHRPPPPHGTYEADGADFVIRPTHYAASPDGISFSLALPSSDLTASQPHSLTPLPFTARQYGRHSATNAAAVVATLQAAGLPYNEGPWRKAVAAFRGVARRFDHVGTTRHGIAVFDDYAHNVEKVCAAIAAAQELSPPTPGLLVIFQPHGYGPFKFMREPLLEALRAQLRPHDTFAFLPVFYAGGTTSFSPKSEEVCAEYAAAGLHVRNFASKAEAEAFVAAGADSARTVLVLGARDPALPHWCATLAAL